MHLSARILCTDCHENSIDNGEGFAVFNIRQENGEKKFFVDDAIFFLGLQLRGIEFDALCKKCAGNFGITDEMIVEASRRLQKK